jgi:ribosomal protein L35
MGQVSTSTITGTVRDSSGSIIPGAKVTILQKATAESRDLITNDHGEFQAPNLHIGEYSVTVTVAGFKSQVFSDVVLEVDKVVNLPFALQPGVVTETVEVTSGAPLVDTERSSAERTKRLGSRALIRKFRAGQRHQLKPAFYGRRRPLSKQRYLA